MPRFAIRLDPNGLMKPDLISVPPALVPTSIAIVTGLISCPFGRILLTPLLGFRSSAIHHKACLQLRKLTASVGNFFRIDLLSTAFTRDRDPNNESKRLHPTESLDLG